MNKENIKNLTIIILVLIVVGCGFLFLEKEPKSIEKKDSFEMQQKCQQVGEGLYEADVKASGKDNLCNPEYAFNEDLNTCLYFGCYIANNSIQKWIKDSFSNKELYLYFQTSNGVLPKSSMCDVCVSLEEFDNKKEELFKR